MPQPAMPPPPPVQDRALAQWLAEVWRRLQDAEARLRALEP
jgi:hypothetical protein